MAAGRQMQQRGMSSPVTQPVFVIVDVQPKEFGIPTKAYVTVEEVSEVPSPLASSLAVPTEQDRTCG